MADTKFKKGHPKLPKAGRKKGTPNKFTTLKQAFLDAFNSKEIGGTQGLIDVFGKSDFTKREFFKLISKMLPSNMDIEHSGNINLIVSNDFLPQKDT